MKDLTNQSNSSQTISILTETNVKQRIPIGGQIRPGIKVLTKTYADNEVAKDLYARGVAAGASFDAIDKAIRKQLSITTSPFKPVSVPYFYIVNRSSDLSTKKQIINLYGEDRGDGHGPQLYSFPILFPSDDIQLVMPTGLNSYTYNERIYWSDYDVQGRRRCYMHGSVPKDKTGKSVRQFGGRPTVLRDWNDGFCDPETCSEYQATPQKCKLSGRFVFYIPGVSGNAAFELPTTSFYALSEAQNTLAMIASVRKGNISGTVNGEPIFMFTKEQQKVSMLDDGKAKKVNHWIIKLRANIDMQKIFAEQESMLSASNQTYINSLQFRPNEAQLIEGDIEE